MKTLLQPRIMLGATLLAVLFGSQTHAVSFLAQASAAESCNQNPSPRSAGGHGVTGNGRFVTVTSDGKLRCSTDGHQWEPAYVPLSDFIRGVTFGNGQFVAVGGSYAGRTAVILTSSNGRRWSVVICPAREVLHAVAYGDGMFVAVGGNGLILSSSNGHRWQQQASGVEATLATVAFGRGIFVAGGDDGVVLTRDGRGYWTARSSCAALSIGQIAFQGDEFHAASCTLKLVSDDGIAWRSSELRNVVAATDSAASSLPVPQF